MPDLLKQFDSLLADDGPAAVVLKQSLKPVGGDVFYPPTYANPDAREKRPVYNIDRFADGMSVCVVDSIPSQANRIEPAFARIADGKLVPQVIVSAELTKEKELVVSHLLEAGHRAADALVRFSSLAWEVTKAIAALKHGDALPLAKLAPTSLVFGIWDSRDTGVKVPRLINSIIRAYNVDEHRRSAQYTPALNYADVGVGGDQELQKNSTQGMAEVPATFQHGGISARGGIVRDASLNLCTLRDIATPNPLKPDAKQTLALQRYVLGLSLVAITYFDGKTLNLRQGCQLVAVPEKPMSRVLVNADGTDSPFAIDRDGAIAYATAVAEAFGVGADHLDVRFDAKSAKAALKKEKKGAE